MSRIRDNGPLRVNRTCPQVVIQYPVGVLSNFRFFKVVKYILAYFRSFSCVRQSILASITQT